MDRFDSDQKQAMENHFADPQPETPIIDRFMEVYERHLTSSVKATPELYGRSDPDHAEDYAKLVCSRMKPAIIGNHFNKDSPAFRATCRELRIPHTYRAIREHLQPDLDALKQAETDAS